AAPPSAPPAIDTSAARTGGRSIRKAAGIPRRGRRSACPRTPARRWRAETRARSAAASSGASRLRERQPFLHVRQVLPRAIDGVRASAGELECALGAAAPFRRRVVQQRCDEPLLLQPLERRVHRTDADIAPGPFGDL